MGADEGYLVTGVPGFIGRRLVQALAPRGRPVHLLCERRFLDDTRALAREVDPSGLRVRALPGDITQDDLGLGAEDLDRVRAEVTDLYHLAAVYDLAVPEEVARKVNVVGTGKVVELLRRRFPAGRVRHHYVSTCYVAGRREGMIFEDELDKGQEFKNHYESTKFAAEVLVEQSKRDVETRIFRPAVVIGDSRTGETQKFDGPYPGFGAVMMGLMIALPGPARGRVNLVPVDWIVDCLAFIPGRPDTAGKTFQLADPEPMTSAELIALAAERLGAPRPRFSVPAALFKPLFKWRRLVELTGMTPQAFEYVNHLQVFDTANTRAALAGTGRSCPPLASYLNQILRYYRDRVELPWRLDDRGAGARLGAQG